MSFTSDKAAEQSLFTLDMIVANLKVIEQGVPRYPDNVEVYMRRVAAWMLLNQWNAAIEECDLILN